MSATSTRVSWADGMAIADALLGLLAPVCERIDVCGSLRRGSPTVGDVDIIAIPRLEPMLDMFDAPLGQIDLLDHHLNTLCGERVVEQARRPDGGPVGWGKKLKHGVYMGLPFQIQAGEPDSYGMLQIIRTGPAAYAHAMVMTVERGFTVRDRASGKVLEVRSGLLPRGFSVEGGYRLHRAHVFIPTPEEADVYAAIDELFVPPEQRR